MDSLSSEQGSENQLVEGLILGDEVRVFLESYYSTQHLQSILRSLNRPPKETTLRVNLLKGQKQEVKDLLKHHLKGTQYEDSVFEHALLEDCLVIPCTGPNPISTKYPEIIVDCKCGEAVLRGADIFTPGVMGAAGGIHSGDRVSVFIDVDKKIHIKEVEDLLMEEEFSLVMEKHK